MQRLVVVGAVALVLSALLVVAGVTRKPAGVIGNFGTDPSSISTLEPLWDAPDFRYVDQDGRPVTRATFAGDVWIADFVFTQCRTVCPLLTSKMVELQRRLAGVKVRFVSFSVDPRHDTPDVLRAYAKHWAPEESRWTLVATDEETLPGLAAGFKVTAERRDDPLDPILHTSLFLLVDGAGRVRGAFDTEHGDQLAALEEGARKLAGAGAARGSPELPTTGIDLYHALSCAKCHERPELAPPLVDLQGRRRDLENGLVAVADEAWVRESILQPDAKRVKGYPLRMPTYAGILDEARLRTLVAWVLARRSASPDGDASDDTAIEEDPVCHMQVRVTPDAITASVAGRTVHFCSSHCRDRYLANASAFAPAASSLPTTTERGTRP